MEEKQSALSEIQTQIMNSQSIGLTNGFDLLNQRSSV